MEKEADCVNPECLGKEVILNGKCRNCGHGETVVEKVKRTIKKATE